MIGDTNVRVMPVVAGTQIDTLEVETLVKVNENGAPVEYMIVNQGNPDPDMYDASCDGCWLLRKDIAENRKWDSTNNDYQNSDIHAYLNGDWTSRYDAGILSQIKQVKIPYVNGDGGSPVASGANGLSCKIFLLSGYELGWTTSNNPYFPRDGAKLSYFSSGTSSVANNKRIANYNGSATNWWLRSPHTYFNVSAWSVNSNGGYGGGVYSSTYGVRPAFILPSTARVDDNFNVISA